MKYLALTFFWMLPLAVFCQLTFEPVTAPDDFSIGHVRKSPTGEFFLQSALADSVLYTSSDGIDWVATKFLRPIDLNDLIFFDNGTPLLQGEEEDHLVRRGDQWETMSLEPGGPPIQASYYGQDTLFVFHGQQFAYSLDSGLTFESLSTYQGALTNHEIRIWRYEDQFVLYQRHIGSDSAYVFDRSGNVIFKRGFQLETTKPVFHECGRLICLDEDRYFSLSLPDLQWKTGKRIEIFPAGTHAEERLHYFNHAFYIKSGNTIYSSSCLLDWVAVFSDNRLNAHSDIQLYGEERFLLYDTRKSYFLENHSGSSQWNSYVPDLHAPWIHVADQAFHSRQLVGTENRLFAKHIADPVWTLIDEDATTLDIQFGIDGRIYVLKGETLLCSKDHGASFDFISLPTNFLFNPIALKVLDEQVLVLFGDYLHFHYSLNGGKDWKRVDLSLLGNVPEVHFHHDTFYIISMESGPTLYILNALTGELSEESFPIVPDEDPPAPVFWNDGTMYFQHDPGFNPIPHLYRFRPGSNVEYLGYFGEIKDTRGLYTTGNDLYAFDNKRYFVWNGESFDPYPCYGLPESDPIEFSLSRDHYVFAIVGHQYVYRSTAPLLQTTALTGVLRHDTDAACLESPEDIPLENWMIRLEGPDGARHRLTSFDGSYHFLVMDGTYTLYPEKVNPYWDLCQASYEVTVQGQPSIVERNILAKATSDCAYLTLDFSTPFLRRCFDGFYNVQVRNTGPANSAGTKLTMELDPFFDFISASIPWEMINDSVLVFDLGAIGFQEVITFRIDFYLSCDAELGREHCLRGHLSDIVLCGSDRSSYEECQENIGAFDPNDKRIFNAAGLETTSVDKGEYIYYHIRFQNTGTDTAFTVRIVDPLSPMLDVSTLEFLSASHAYTYSLSDGPALVVTFNDIRLVDSTANEPASHGYVKFRIKPYPQFDYGTAIPNQASIFFDFNEPVLTNTPEVVILPTTRVRDLRPDIGVGVYPNPANEVLYLRLDDASVYVTSYYMTDMTGRIVGQDVLTDAMSVSTGHLVSGVYTIYLRAGEDVVGAARFVRM